jgi:hypothetical protein
VKYKLVLQVVLGATISVPYFYGSPSSVQAHNLCTSWRDYVNPLKQCQHTHFEGSNNTPNPVGYFDNGVTVFYSNGYSHCGFLSRKHLEFSQRVYKARSLGRRNPINFGSVKGVCQLPSGYFDNGATVFFSAGDGSFCGFLNPPALASHKQSRPQQPSFGRIDIDPNKFMTNTDVCQ